MSALLVELLGLPGSGKTSLAAATRAALRSDGLVADVVDEPISAAMPRSARMLRRTAAATRTALAAPAWTARCAGRIATVPQPALRDTASVLAQWLAIRDLSCRARQRGGLQVLEEGPRQTLWSLALRSPDAASLTLLESLPAAAQPDVVVVLDVPLEVVQHRLVLRESRHSRTQHLSRDLLRSELSRGQELVELLAVATPTPVIRLTGGDDVPAARLGRILADALNPHPTSASA